jgi:hypothetical protein
MTALHATASTPDTIADWKAASEALLSDPCCAFHRNMEISSRYARLHEMLPSCFKWAAMAAIASHHVRLALYPLRFDTDGTGFVDLPRSLGRRRILFTGDVDTIRMTNNGIFDDIFWVHLAYVTAEDGIASLRDLLGDDLSYGPILSAFEAIDRGRKILEAERPSSAAGQRAQDLIWAGNVQILEHEQRALVQPHFDQLSCAFARLISLGSVTSFEVRGVRGELSYATSFYANAFTRGLPHALSAFPRITRFDDRWRWLTTGVVPRFRRLDADPRLVEASLRRIVDEAREFASIPCVVPHASEAARRR